MYRFLKIQGTSLQSIYYTTSQINVQCSMKVCSFCKIHHAKTMKLNILPTRYFATTVNTAKVSLQLKKRLRQNRKYTELLEVGDNSTSSKKASVKKLNAFDVSELIKQPDITLDKLHKITKKNKSTTRAKRKKEIATEETNNELSCYPISKENLELYEKLSENNNIDFNYTDHVDHSSQDILEENEDLKLSKKIKKEKKSKAAQMRKLKQQAIEETAQRRKMVNKDLQEKLILSHLEVYIDCGMMNRVERTLLFLKENNLKSIKAYNIVMDMHTANGNLEKVLQILQWIKEDSLQPVAQTFAAVYECIGKMKNLDKQKELLREINAYMNDSKLTFLDVLKDSKCKNSQREYILAAIKILEPDFELTYDNVDQRADCKLIKFNEINRIAPKNLPPLEELKKLAEEQIRLECVGEMNIKSVGKLTKITDQTHLNRKKIAKFEEQTIQSATENFELSLKYLKQEERNSVQITNILSPFLEVLPKEVYVKSILQETRKLIEGSANFTITLSSLRLNLGTHIYKKYELQTRIKSGILQQTKDIYMKYLDWYVKDQSENNSRITWELMKSKAEREGTPLDQMCTEWPIQLRYKIGKFLYDIILNDIKFVVQNAHKQTQKLPVFYIIYRSQGKHLKEQIKAHPFLIKLYHDAQSEVLKFETTLVPSQSPPRPWTSVHSGGYLITKCDLIRMTETNAMLQKMVLYNTPSKQLYTVFDSLNQLGNTPWIINKKVLDNIIKIFQNGGSQKLNIPRPPSELPLPPRLDSNASVDERIRVLKMRLSYETDKNEMYSQWCDALYRLSLANHFRDRIFWLPHNLDFRGRVYPIPPHLHHLNSDLARSLLLFAEGKPLGPNGYDWLKIHAINLTGQKKKESIASRLEYANSVLDDIIDSAENPLTGKMWWADSDDPWQTLAACMEIANVQKFPDPEKYVCHLPIHQDGSCNGLQHYAALGRDELGARAVNLAPSEKPQDVYSAIASLVEKARQEDAKAGLDIAFLLEGRINRKVVKQTVMTTVYGVTKFGASLQIRKQLKAFPDFPEEYLKSASSYMADRTFQSLGTMFSGAKEIQDWLTDCANIISVNYNQYVQWVTPLGLPVVQAYSKKNVDPIRKAHGFVLKPDSAKQRNAFAPNFIHSLDSSHMMLTSLHCEKEGITFVSVHDCYWTHISTVNIMNKICRNQFVALHSEPILENLANFFMTCFKTMPCSGESPEVLLKRLTNVPKKGEFDLQKVLSSVYFFS